MLPLYHTLGLSSLRLASESLFRLRHNGKENKHMNLPLALQAVSTTRMSDSYLHDAAQTDLEALVRTLHDADEDDARIRAALRDDALNSYTLWESQELAGAAVVCWADVPAEESEIVLLAVAADRRGQGRGKRMVAALLEEARRRSVRVLQVGTGSMSLDNIAFYQKCGFRMSHVRRDYFDYIQPSLVVDGITLRDMIVFEYVLEAKKD